MTKNWRMNKKEITLDVRYTKVCMLGFTKGFPIQPLPSTIAQPCLSARQSSFIKKINYLLFVKFIG